MRTAELVVGFLFDKLNAMHFDCSQTLSLVIVAARDNGNEQLKCATSNSLQCARSHCALRTARSRAVTGVHDWD